MKQITHGLPYGQQVGAIAKKRQQPEKPLFGHVVVC
jgi:hypothetical protein